MVFNATFNNACISVISWRSVLLAPAFNSLDFDLMEIITETHRAQQITYLLFYYCTFPIIVHGKGSPYLSEKRGLRN
jgi:hypothetical protein